ILSRLSDKTGRHSGCCRFQGWHKPRASWEQTSGPQLCPSRPVRHEEDGSAPYRRGIRRLNGITGRTRRVYLKNARWRCRQCVHQFLVYIHSLALWDWYPAQARIYLGKLGALHLSEACEMPPFHKLQTRSEEHTSEL